LKKSPGALPATGRPHLRLQHKSGPRASRNGATGGDDSQSDAQNVTNSAATSVSEDRRDRSTPQTAHPVRVSLATVFRQQKLSKSLTASSDRTSTWRSCSPRRTTPSKG
jgi:hypothetical protein